MKKDLLRVSLSNKKLVPSARTRFLVWNIPARVTCPYATEHCKGACYACKSERCYPTVLPARQENFSDSRRADFAERMTETIDAYMGRPSFKKAEQVFFRVHESGDFYNREYTRAWLEIARRAFEKYGHKLIFVAYTKSLPFFVGETIPANFSIVASEWDDTAPEMIALNRDVLHFPVYTADTLDNVLAACVDPSNYYCRCSDCGECRACFMGQMKKIFCVIH